VNDKIVLYNQYNKSEVEMFLRILEWVCSVYHRREKHIINERKKGKIIDVAA